MSLLTRRSEGTASHSLWSRVTQKVYLLVLITLVGYLAYIAFSRTFYLQERGLIEIERTVISSAQGGRIIGLYAKEGQRVNKNDLLVMVDKDKAQCLAQSDQRINKLVLEIEASRQKRDFITSKLKALESIMSQGVLRRALEADYARADQGAKLAQEIESLKLEKQLLGLEITQQQSLLHEMKSTLKSNNACADEEIRAPQQGRVQAISRDLYEVVKRGEIILNFIADDAAVYAETYIEDEHINQLEKNKDVSVLLPNQRETTGMIFSVRSSAAMRAHSETSDHVPPKTRLVVRVSPKTEQDAELWKQHDRMNVHVSIVK